MQFVFFGLGLPRAACGHSVGVWFAMSLKICYFNDLPHLCFVLRRFFTRFAIVNKCTKNSKAFNGCLARVRILEKALNWCLIGFMGNGIVGISEEGV